MKASRCFGSRFVCEPLVWDFGWWLPVEAECVEEWEPDDG